MHLYQHACRQVKKLSDHQDAKRQQQEMELKTLMEEQIKMEKDKSRHMEMDMNRLKM